MSGKQIYKIRSRDRDRDGKIGEDHEKQIGCMNGIFQLFLVGHRSTATTASHNLKRLPAPPGQNANHGNECKLAADKSPVQKKVVKEIAKEKQSSVPTESSRTSFSSSCSSTFSSDECNKNLHPEPPSSRQRIFPETPSHNFPNKQTDPSLQLKQSPDKRDLVKDSMYREARGVSIKTLAKEERKGRAMKHIDSPRPLLQSKPVRPRVTGDGSTHGSLPLGPKDAPRFSYDGRTSQYSLKSTVMIKELPKLSLDSRERSLKSSAAESRSNYLLTDIGENGNSNQILNQEPGNNKRPSSVVARLMGLEALPDSVSPGKDLNAISRFGDESKQNQVSRSLRVTHKDPTSNSRFPLEPAPWGSQNRRKIPNAAPSVYGEIEQRLTELEFKKSGKDLRALKQILDAMQKTRSSLENEKEDQQPSNVKSQTSKYDPKYSSFHQSNYPFSPTIKGTDPPRSHGSTVLMDKKKTKARTPRAPPSSRAPQQKGEKPTSFRRISGTVSPRLQQTKNRVEKQCPPITPPSDSRRARKQPRKQPVESGSPTRKLKPKSTNLQQGDDRSSGLSGESRNLSRHSDTASVQFDEEVTSIYSSNDLKDKNFEARLTEDKSIAELATATLEQPSPISVLDATFYGEGSPSPVKKISNAFEDDESAHYDKAEWDAVDIDHLLNSTRPSLSSKFNKHLVHKLRLANSSDDEANTDDIESLRSTNPDHKYITEILLASGFLEDQGFCSSNNFINPNLFHLLEKTKGNTEIANDEQNRNIAESKSNEKIQRKLVFDAVSEILGRKLALLDYSIFPKKLERRRSSGEKLLKELWSEVENLQSKGDCSVDDEGDGWRSILHADMMNQSNDWKDYHDQFSGLVLDIERQIFRDLIREVINGGAAAELKDRLGNYRRQLFST